MSDLKIGMYVYKLRSFCYSVKRTKRCVPKATIFNISNLNLISNYFTNLICSNTSRRTIKKIIDNKIHDCHWALFHELYIELFLLIFFVACAIRVRITIKNDSIIRNRTKSPLFLELVNVLKQI